MGDTKRPSASQPFKTIKIGGTEAITLALEIPKYPVGPRRSPVERVNSRLSMYAITPR